MFPESQDDLATGAQELCYSSVPPSVEPDFRLPVTAIGLERVSAFRATMPEAAIDENDYSAPIELKIRPSGHGGWVQSPSGNTCTCEGHSQGELG